MNFSLVLTLNYLHLIHYEYIYPVHFVLDKFSNSISSTTKSPRTKKFYSPRLFLHARSSLPPVAVRHRVKKSVERENSAKNPSILFSFHPLSFLRIIDTPPSSRKASINVFRLLRPSPLEFVYSFLRKRARGREGSIRFALRI